MIAQIRGKLIASTFTEVVVDVGGVGYRLCRGHYRGGD